MMNLHNIHFSKFKATIFLENLKDLKAKNSINQMVIFPKYDMLIF